jgi:mRNA-degrading endonuclease toxin of MazEF toxin-antitoxin module
MTRTNPRRGEIWLVDLNPTRGQEIQKTRPAIIVSTNLFQGVPLRIVVPVTSMSKKFRFHPTRLRSRIRLLIGCLLGRDYWQYFGRGCLRQLGLR